MFPGGFGIDEQKVSIERENRETDGLRGQHREPKPQAIVTKRVGGAAMTALELPPRPSASLYELITDRDDLRTVIEMLDYEENAEALDILTKQLDALDVELPHKAGNVCRFLRNVECRVEQIGAEIERLTARKVIYKNKVQRLKDYLKLCLDRAGLKKLAAGVFDVSVRANGGAQPRDMERIEAETLRSCNPQPIDLPTSIPGVSWRHSMTLVIDDKALPDEYKLPRVSHVRVS